MHLHEMERWRLCWEGWEVCVDDWPKWEVVKDSERLLGVFIAAARGQMTQSYI